MVLYITNEEGLVESFIGMQQVDNKGNTSPNGEYLYIDEMYVAPSKRGNFREYVEYYYKESLDKVNWGTIKHVYAQRRDKDYKIVCYAINKFIKREKETI